MPDETFNAVKKTLEDMEAKKDVPITVSLDEEQFNALTSNEKDVTVNANTEPAQTKLGELYTDMLKPHDITAGIKFTDGKSPDDLVTEAQTKLDAADVNVKAGVELKENAGTELELTEEDTPNLTAKAGVQLKEGAGSELTLGEDATPNLSAKVQLDTTEANTALGQTIGTMNTFVHGEHSTSLNIVKTGADIDTEKGKLSDITIGSPYTAEV